MDRAFREAFDSLPWTASLYDEGGLVRAVNAAARERVRVAGFAEDPVGRPWQEAFPTLAGTGFGRLLERTRQAAPGSGISDQSFTTNADYRVFTRHLGRGWVIVYSEPQSAVEASAQEALNVRRERDALIRSYPFGTLASFDASHRYLVVGGESWEALGIDPVSLEGKRFRELFPAETAERLDELAAAALRGESPTLRVAYGGRVSDLHAGPLPPGPDGAPRGFFITRDVTEEVAAHEERERARRLAELGVLASTVAHDFNNLLMEIQGWSEALRDGLADGSASEQDLDAILRATERGSALVQQLLRHGRREPGGERVAEIAELVPNLRAVVPASVVLGVDVPSGLRVAMPPDHLLQVLMNLVRNAADAMPGGGRIRVTAGTSRERMVELRVEDEGEGMAPEIAERALEPFFSTKGERGTGLGLAAVQDYVRRSSGRLRVDSAPGAGTRVVIELPQVGASASAASTRATATNAGPELTLRAGRRVLVVEDEDGVRRSIARYLSRRGVHVDQAADGREALQRLAARRDYDLVLTDLDMPGLRGDELIARAHGDIASEARFALMSGDTSRVALPLPRDVVELRKPFALSRLLTLLDAGR